MLTTYLLVLVFIFVVAHFRHTHLQRKRLESKIREISTMVEECRMKAMATKPTLMISSEDTSALHDTISLTVQLLLKNGVRLFMNTLPERIGHLALETDLWLKEMALNDADRTKCGFIVTPESVANKHLLSYWNDQFCFTIPVAYWTALAKHFPEVKNLMSIRHDYGVAYQETATLYDLYKRWGHRDSLLKLRDEDIEHGRAIMSNWGIKDGEWFVCFHNREPGYAPHDDEHHTYRNSPISNMVPAMKEIVAHGGWVVRMGDPAMTPLSAMDRVIDYAHSADRSARMDVILCAMTKFFVGNTSGLFIVSTIFGVPVAGANFAPMSAMQYTHRDISMPKMLYSEKKKRLLTFQEVLGSPLGNNRYSAHFEKENVRVLDNTDDEILGLVHEMLERDSGLCEYTEEDEKLQRVFLNLLNPGHYGYGSAARISRYFLHKHKALLPNHQ